MTKIFSPIQDTNNFAKEHELAYKCKSYERGRNLDSLQPLIGNDLFEELKNKLTHSKNLLEVGCGNGALCAQLAGAYPHVKTQGIDLNPITRENVGNWTFEQGNGISILKQKVQQQCSFDVILCIEVAPYFQNQLELVDLIYQLLPDNGLAIITTHPFYFGNQYDKLFPPECEIQWVADRDVLLIKKNPEIQIKPWRNFRVETIPQSFLRKDRANRPYLFTLWDKLSTEMQWGMYESIMRGKMQRHPFKLSLPTIVAPSQQKFSCEEEAIHYLEQYWQGLDKVLCDRPIIQTSGISHSELCAIYNRRTFCALL